MIRLALLICLTLSVTACSSIEKQSSEVEIVAQQYFSHYAKRDDFQNFLYFYAENAQLIDVVYGHHAQSKLEIAKFLDWQRGEFALLDGDKVLTITEQVTQGSTVITQGYFHRFNYDGNVMGPWLFSIILEFDDNNKIIKQTDWINYMPKESFIGGKNINLLIAPK